MDEVTAKGAATGSRCTMRLSYVTRANVPSKAAQATQIACMAQAFAGELGPDFTLTCGGPAQPGEPFRRRPLQSAGGQWRRYAAAAAAAVQQVWGQRRTVVFTRDIGVALVTVLAGGRAVFEAHKEPKGRVAPILVRLLARARRFRLVAISAALGTYYRDRLGMPVDRVLVAHDGVFADDYALLRGLPKQALRESLGLPTDRLLVVHTGSLYQGRGAELFENVLKAHPAALFVQVGGDPADIAHWRQHYESLGIPGPRFVDRQEAGEVRKYQVAADLLFYMITRDTSTFWCCSPLKLFEYMASGTPMLAARIGSLTEVIDESNAYCFDPDQPDSIARAIDTFLADGPQAKRKADLALTLAESTYSWQLRARAIARFAHADHS